ncbi:MAG: NADH:flavin oxidoreductase [Deltaproteobacteria bacterium]|nr:NADH:flavin oxidoreductase [Deltaproteobacteria bacterium]
MSKLFEPGTIQGMVLSNRFVRSATWEGMAAEDGAVTPKLIQTMVALVKGRVGMIISSHAYIREEGQAGPWQIGVYKDELIHGLKEMAAAVHENGGKIVMQLAHAGCFAAQSVTGTAAWAASDFEGLGKTPRHEMTVDDIQSVTLSFAEAARRAKTAGFDGVQIHSAHGYLLSQFLSPLYNRRRDDYGGSIENRARFLLGVLRAIRNAVGEAFPILAKLNCGDFVEGGLNTDDAIQVGRMLADAGLDALEISGGLLTGGRMNPSRVVKSEEQEAYFKNEARAFREELGIPLILVGGIRSFETAEKLLDDGTVDFISMSRPFIREPDLVNRWKSGDRRKALCRSDNACFKPGMEGKGIYCVTAEVEKAKSED